MILIPLDLGRFGFMVDRQMLFQLKLYLKDHSGSGYTIEVFDYRKYKHLNCSGSDYR